MTSGVSQGSVLDPILFLVYTNDLHENITSQVRLFADDAALYLTIEGADDNPVLLQNLDCLCSRLSVASSSTLTSASGTCGGVYDTH